MIDDYLFGYSLGILMSFLSIQFELQNRLKIISKYFPEETVIVFLKGIWRPWRFNKKDEN